MSSSDEDAYSMIFSSLKHPIRRKILRILSLHSQTFTDLQRQFNIESPHLTYHIDGLGNLINKTEKGKYSLSSFGEAAVSMMKNVEEPRTANSTFTHRARILKVLTLVLTCVLITSLVFNAFLLVKNADSDKAFSTLDKAYNGLNQAYMQLNSTNYSLNQAYTQLESASNDLQNAINKLNSTYQTLLTNTPSNRVFNVNTGIEYQTIQDGINNAEDGNTVLVGAGIYYEHVSVNRSITLMGAGTNDTIVDGSHQGVVVTIAVNNVIFEGFTVQRSGADQIGIDLLHSNNSIVRENIVTLNGMYGVAFDDSFNNSVNNNIISSTIGNIIGLGFGDGIIIMRSSADNFIINNAIINCTEEGITLDTSNDNVISGNLLQENGQLTLYIHSSRNNTIYLNNFIQNGGSIHEETNGTPTNNNIWSLQGKGNYWDDYTGLDDGSNGRLIADGVGDTNLPWNGVDNYPLINPANPLPISWDNQVFPTIIASNSTVFSFRFNQPNKRITFSVTGISNTTGYMNLTIPSTLLSGPWQILLDGTDVTSQAILTTDENQAKIYLDYNQSSHSIQVVGTQVVPEYSIIPATFLLMLILFTPIILPASNRIRNFAKKLIAHFDF